MTYDALRQTRALLEQRAEIDAETCLHVDLCQNGNELAGACAVMLLSASPDRPEWLLDVLRQSIVSVNHEERRPDTGCLDCTQGTTPRSTGLCWYHEGMVILRETPYECGCRKDAARCRNCGGCPHTCACDRFIPEPAEKPDGIRDVREGCC